MIRHQPHPAAARRLAVVEVGRDPLHRLGRVGRVGTIREWDWTLVPSLATMNVEPYAPQQPFTATGQRDMTPRTSSAWMAQIVARQSVQRESTPGTLTWTPTSTPQANISAPWNSWAGPCAGQRFQSTSSNGANGDGASISAASSGAGQQPVPTVLYVAAGLGAAAAAAYLLNTLFSGNGNR